MKVAVTNCVWARLPKVSCRVATAKQSN